MGHLISRGKFEVQEAGAEVDTELYYFFILFAFLTCSALYALLLLVITCPWLFNESSNWVTDQHKHMQTAELNGTQTYWLVTL